MTSTILIELNNSDLWNKRSIVQAFAKHLSEEQFEYLTCEDDECVTTLSDEVSGVTFMIIRGEVFCCEDIDEYYASGAVGGTSVNFLCYVLG